MEFLRELAEVFIENEHNNLKDICFVFPNRRSSIFFQRYLGEVSKSTIFSPTLITINDLFYNLSGLRNSDKISLLTLLYSVYSRYNTAANESFDDFIYWGDMILNDFDDVDKYLVDANHLFTNIKDLKDIDSGFSFLSEDQREAIKEFWGNFSPFSKEKKEQSFLSLWTILYDIYIDFKNELRIKGEGYEGMIYRSVADQINKTNQFPVFLNKYKKIVFVALNALNKCEKVLLNALRDSGKGDFYWDYYGDIIKDPYNKSSLFMSENVVNYPSKYQLTKQDKFQNPEIEVIGIPSKVGQAKYVHKILQDLLSSSHLTQPELIKTAVVLPDETLLLPLLNSIPDDIKLINVTMGYSLSNTNISSFMTLISSLQNKVRLYHSKISFYYSTVLDILDHPYIKEIDQTLLNTIRDKIIKNNMAFISPHELRGAPILDAVFIPVSHMVIDRDKVVGSIADYQLNILLELQKLVNDLDKEFIFAYFKSINRLKDIDLPIKPDTYFKLLHQITSGISIPFSGEPLSGLQIMGPLETRSLDFENMIILSINDGVFPSSSVSSSFIPYNLRRGWGLPNYEFQDSISAYHFYRSIYRVNKLFLIYDTRVEGVKSGEVSRFVKQLKYHHELPVKEKIISVNIDNRQRKQTLIEKNKNMLEALYQLEFSPSSFRSYLDCPLKFYYEKIEKLKRPQELIFEMEANSFGTLFHKVMSDIYSPFINTNIHKKEIEETIRDKGAILKYIHNAFNICFGIDDIFGRNKIIEVLVERYVKRVLQHDMELVPFSYLLSEKNVVSTIYIDSLAKDIKLKGIIDRVDKVDGSYRIIDYKTGSFNINYNEINDLFDPESDAPPNAAFQLIFYLYLLSKDRIMFGNNSLNQDNTILSIYSLKDIFKDVTPQFMLKGEELSLFENNLKKLLEEIFDLTQPFKGCNNEDTCSYCDFKLLCKR